MKYLKNRQEVAKAMNFGKYPVLRINRETPKEGYKDYFVGDLVKVMTPSKSHPDLYATGTLYWSEGKYGVMTDCTCLHDDFGYYDVKEMLARAQDPVLHAGETVVVVEDYPNLRSCTVHMMKVSDHVNGFVYPCCTLVEIPEDEK